MPERDAIRGTRFLARCAAQNARNGPVRLVMDRFNRYWSQRAVGTNVELKPTAGYALDAGRWLKDARSIYTPAEKQLLVRLA